MKTITKKSEIKIHLESCLAIYHANGLQACVAGIHKTILSNKVKFPLLEYCGEGIYNILPGHEQCTFCDLVQSLKTEGGNVISGIILQKRLTDDFNQSIEKATDFIADAGIWYVCDIIGERVFGFALLNQPQRTLPLLKRLSNHHSHWVIRALGAGVHYAVKKGLNEEAVKAAFQILLSKAGVRNKEIRQGIGWAAKTTAKFHPKIVEHFKNEIDNQEKVANWFRKKITIGLSKNKYIEQLKLK